MKVLYAAQYKHGSTSRMRGEYLKSILKPESFVIADTDLPIAGTSRIFRTLGWRYYKGPLIKNVSNFMANLISQSDHFDVAWIDKGEFIAPSVLKDLKRKTSCLIHYTPDTAFYYNRSPHFYDGIRYYDHCITTKSFEIDKYQELGAKNVLFCTQGYDPDIHKPMVDFDKKKDIVFVGLCEPSREDLIAYLIGRKIKVRVAGEKWESFAKKYQNSPYFEYYGEGLFGRAYAQLISESYIGLGLLSKKFPELHTTRTFEIPACKTLLATEDNQEVRKYFDDKEVLYFNSKEELAEKIIFLLDNPNEIQIRIQNASEKLRYLKADYVHIMTDLLYKMHLL